MTTVTFDHLYTAHARHVRHQLTRLLGRRHSNEVADVCQDVWCRVAMNLPSYRGDAAPGSWVYRIAFNTAMSYLRSPKARRQALLLTLEAVEHLSDTTPPPDTLLQSSQLRERLQEVLMDRMPGCQAEVLRLRYLHGMSLADIARVTGQKEATVKSRLYRGRQVVLKAFTAAL